MKSLFFAAALLVGSAAVAQTTPDPNMTSPGDTVAPSNANPELDARGISVISDAATAPAGFNTGQGGPLVDASTRPAPVAAVENYPACSRTVTDNCVQTYERGRNPR